MPQIQFFKLQEGERVTEKIKPLPSLRWYFFLTWAVVIIFILVWFMWMPFAFGSFFVGGIALASVALLLVLLWVLSGMRYNHQLYWLTNKRVIVKRGLLGYRVSSIPLERISDVIVSRSFVERLFGFGSVMIQSLAGQITAGRRFGAEGSLLAVTDPEGTQKLIFDLIKKKRKAEHITM